MTIRSVAISQLPEEAEAVDTSLAWASVKGFGEGGAVLVRPDGHVAWRAHGPATDPEAEFRAVMETLLHEAEKPE